MTTKKKAKAIGRPKSGTKISRSVGFDPPVFHQLEALADLTGKSFAKLVQEGGEAVVQIYRKKGYDV